MNQLQQVTIAALFYIFLPIVSYAQQVQKTEILILGTQHLNYLPESFESSHLDRVIAELAKKNFDLIAIENMPGERINEINGRQLLFWREEMHNYVGKRIDTGIQFQQVFGMSYAEAYELKSSLLYKTSLSESERVSMLKASLCLYDNWSALLHFNSIEDTGKLPPEVLEHVGKYAKSRNEINLIAVKLAHAQQHNSLYLIDDLDDEARLFLHKPKFFEEYPNIEGLQDKVMNHPLLAKVAKLEEEGIAQEDLFDLYRFLNSEEYTQGDYEAQWEIWFETNLQSKGDLARYYLWEMRNLRISANLAELIALNPGKRILVMIGASHKSFLEKYLRQMPHIELLKF